LGGAQATFARFLGSGLEAAIVSSQQSNGVQRMKNYNPKPSRKEIELLLVEAFRSATQTIDAFERFTMAAWRHSLAKDEADQAVETATVAPEVMEREGVLVCTIKEACRRTGLGRTRIYQAIGSGELRAMKCGQRTLIEMDGIRRWISSLPTVGRKQVSR
jgi:excisionase family DNA binding protein